MYNGTELVEKLAKDAFDFLYLESRTDFDKDLYTATGLQDAVYAQAVVDPNVEMYKGLTAGELENARVAIEAVLAVIESHRVDLSKIVAARP